jgi:hypothetical protein
MTTADAFRREEEALIGIGATHRGRFILFLEAQQALDADVYVLRMRNDESDLQREFNPLGSAPVLPYESFVLGVKLPRGNWTLELESLNHGTIARRQIRVLP